MNYKPYSAYKDSGIEWLGKIPEGWNLSPLFVILPEHYVQNIGMQSSDVLSLSYGEIIQKDVSDNFGLLPESFETYQLVSPDDIILRLTDLQNDQRSLRTAISSFSGIITSAYIKLRCYQDSSYFHWLLYSADIQKVFYGLGGGVRQSIKYIDLKRFPLVVPPLPTQKAIATFLDVRTVRIGGLVRNYEELIALLKEKRQTLVSHAVTRGLSELVSTDDPEFGEWARPVVFKDSGVEWLGEIPEGWDLKKLSFLFKAKKGSNAAQLTKEYCASIEGEYPVYSGQTENDGVMASINTAEFDSGSDGYLFSTTVGAKAMSLMHIRGKFSLSQNCMVIIPLTITTDVRFQYYHMQPLFSYERGLIPEHMQASFRMEDLYKYRLALPPIPIQKAIAAFLDRETARLDALVTEAEGAIELLKERRSALITAAVTGKINVEEMTGV